MGAREAPGGPRRSQRNPEEALVGPRNPQEAARSPWRRQEAPESPGGGRVIKERMGIAEGGAREKRRRTLGEAPRGSPKGAPERCPLSVPTIFLICFAIKN